MPKVYNKRGGLPIPAGAVYVGRPSKFGNPFTHDQKFKTLAIFKVPTREMAVECYRTWLEEHPELVEAARKELEGKDLVCWCAPLRCHADILLEIANADPET